jgi:hypothetical protein
MHFCRIIKVIFVAAFWLIFCAEISLAQETTNIDAKTSGGIIQKKAPEENKAAKVEMAATENPKTEKESEKKPEAAVQTENKKYENHAKKIHQAKMKLKHHIKRIVTIPYEFLLQINLSQDECQKFVGGECFRRDKMREEPYYHKTKLVIFRDKIFAEQFFQGPERRVDKLFLSVPNGRYDIKTNHDNEVSFSVKSGFVNNLKLRKGELEKEREPKSQCNISEIIYEFYQANDPSGIIAKTVLTKDEYNFDGFKEVTFFVEKNRQMDIMVVSKNSNQTPVAVKDLRLCKMPEVSNPEIYFVKYVNNEKCQSDRFDDVAECNKYKDCEDYLVVKDCNVLMLRDPM